MMRAAAPPVSAPSLSSEASHKIRAVRRFAVKSPRTGRCGGSTAGSFLTVAASKIAGGGGDLDGGEEEEMGRRRRRRRRDGDNCRSEERRVGKECRL